MKKLCFLMALLLCLGLCACTNDPGTTQPTEAPGTEAQNPPADTGNGTGEGSGEGPETPADYLQYEKTVVLNSLTGGIKLLGMRAQTSTDQLNADWIGSGLEFVYESKGGNVTLRTSTSDACYFRVWVDGEAWKNTDGSYYYMINGVRNLTISGISAGEHTVRVVRVTDPSLADAHFFSLTFYGELIASKKPAEKEQYIEFVGADTATAWGILGSETKAYKNQDGAMAYTYLAAVAANADYSITAVAGKTLAEMTELYLKTSLREGASAYAFTKKADAVVIDLGAEDFADGELTPEDFATAYIRFLLSVYEKNGPDCKIYCLYNATSDGYKDAILAACTKLGGEAAGIYTLELNRAAGAIPTAAEQEAYAAALVARLSATKDLPVSAAPQLPVGTLTNMGSGTGMELDYNDSKWGN